MKHSDVGESRGTKFSFPHFLKRGRHPPFNTAPVADSQRSLTRCSKRAHARIAKGGGLIALHPLRRGRPAGCGLKASRASADKRASASEQRNIPTDTATPHGGTRHRYRNRRVAHDHGSLRRPSGRGQQAKRSGRNGTPAGKATLHHQRHYPRGAARKPVCRIPVRHSGGAQALGRWAMPQRAAGTRRLVSQV